MNEVDKLVVSGEDRPEDHKKQQELLNVIRDTLRPKKRPKKKEFFDVTIQKEGTQIILPEDMTYSQAQEWLEKRKQEEETVIDFRYRLECYPLDGAVALKRAVDRIFGFSIIKGQNHPFFGEQPPKMLNVKTSLTESELVPWDRICPPPLEGGHLETSVEPTADGLRFAITGRCKRKHEPVIKLVIKLVEHILEYESIYRGQAIKVKGFKVDDVENLNLENDAPSFMELDIEEDNLILHPDVKAQLATSVYMRVEKTAECLAHNVPLKHGVLLMGPYGTGKTLTAKVIARKCEDNGWTFIYLEDSSQLPAAIMFAKTYAPAVLFSEDIDKAVSGERTDALNEILNTIDGIDTKSFPVITVLTTNHPEQIHAGFLRAGRMDTVIPVDKPDADTIARFIEYYARNNAGVSILKKGTKLSKSVNEMVGFVPSFIAEAVNKAKMYAFYREGKLTDLTDDDLYNSAASLRAHQQLMSDNNESVDETPAEKIAGGIKLVMKESMLDFEDAVRNGKLDELLLN